jgi:hypothetical protein
VIEDQSSFLVLEDEDLEEELEECPFPFEEECEERWVDDISVSVEEDSSFMRGSGELIVMLGILVDWDSVGWTSAFCGGSFSWVWESLDLLA